MASRPDTSTRGTATLYLDILREKTLPDIPGDFNRDGRVDGDDLTGSGGWQSRFGTDLSGADLLDWQRTLGYVHWAAPRASMGNMPEPATNSVLIGALLVAEVAVRRERVRRRRGWSGSVFRPGVDVSNHPLMKARRSALITSACVISTPSLVVIVGIVGETPDVFRVAHYPRREGE